MVSAVGADIIRPRNLYISSPPLPKGRWIGVSRDGGIPTQNKPITTRYISLSVGTPLRKSAVGAADTSYCKIKRTGASPVPMTCIKKSASL